MAYVVFEREVQSYYKKYHSNTFTQIHTQLNFTLEHRYPPSSTPVPRAARRAGQTHDAETINAVSLDCASVYSVTAPTGGALCKTTKDLNGQKCGKNKRCKVMYNEKCSKSEDCGNGQFCNAGVCVTDGVPCDTSGAV